METDTGAKKFNTEVKSLGLSLIELSRITGIKQRSLYYYSTGERPVPSWMPFMLKGVRLWMKYCKKDDAS